MVISLLLLLFKSVVSLLELDWFAQVFGASVGAIIAFVLYRILDKKKLEIKKKQDLRAGLLGIQYNCLEVIECTETNLKDLRALLDVVENWDELVASGNPPYRFQPQYTSLKEVASPDLAVNPTLINSVLKLIYDAREFNRQLKSAREEYDAMRKKHDDAAPAYPKVYRDKFSTSLKSSLDFGQKFGKSACDLLAQARMIFANYKLFDKWESSVIPIEYTKDDKKKIEEETKEIYEELYRRDGVVPLSDTD